MTGPEATPDEATPDEALERDAARARAFVQRRDAFELSPEQLARGKLALEAALDENDLRAAHDAARRGTKQGERGRIKRWLYTPVLPVLAGLCALALAVRFSQEEAPARSESASVLALPAPTRELVLAQSARLEARLARLGAPAPSVSDSAGPSVASKAKNAASEQPIALVPGAEKTANVAPEGDSAVASGSAAVAARAQTKPGVAHPDASTERDFDHAMQAYRSQLLASLREGP